MKAQKRNLKIRFISFNNYIACIITCFTNLRVTVPEEDEFNETDD